MTAALGWSVRKSGTWPVVAAGMLVYPGPRSRPGLRLTLSIPVYVDVQLVLHDTASVLEGWNVLLPLDTNQYGVEGRRGVQSYMQ